jgi:hypothetical protein
MNAVARRRVKERGRRSALAGPIKACRWVYFNTTVFQIPRPSFKTSLLHIFHWVTSARAIAAHNLWLYLHDRVSSLPAGHGAAAKCSIATFTSRRRQYQGRQYGHNTQPRQGIVASTTFLFFTASGPLHVLRRSTLQQLTVLFIVFTILFVHLHTKACRTMPFTPTLFDHPSSI